MPHVLKNRLKYPEDENKYDWLGMLLDAYFIADIGLEDELKEIKERVACEQGCKNCCISHEIPILEIELVGISWFASEKLTGDLREKLKKQLLNHEKLKECPFLIADNCSIYPMRPLACRQYIVLNKKCGLHEKINETRPKDIWLQSSALSFEIAKKILHFYGISETKEQEKAFEAGFVFDNSTLMHLKDWTKICITMQLFDDCNKNS